MMPIMSAERLIFWVVGWMVSVCPGLAQWQKFASHFPLDAPDVPADVRAESQRPVWQNAERGPVDDLRVLAREKSGAVWLGGDQGAARFDSKAQSRWDRWQYFHGRRWLLDNQVRNITVQEGEKSRKVWVRTATGVSLIDWRHMTLQEKERYFD